MTDVHTKFTDVKLYPLPYSNYLIQYMMIWQLQFVYASVGFLDVNVIQC